MSINCSLSSPLLFAKLVDILRDLVEAITFEFTSKGLCVTTIDTAHVFLIELNLRSSSAFLDYRIEQSKLVLVSLKVELLHRVLKTIKSGDTVILEVKNGGDLMVSISRIASKATARESTYRIPQVTILDQERIHVPERDFQCEVLLQTSLLVEICTELKDVGAGDSVKMSVTENSLVFEGHDEIMTAKIKISEQSVRGILCSEPYSLVFKHQYFVRMGRVAKLSEATECLMQIGPEQPLAILFQLQKMGAIQFFLAPLLDDE